MDEPLSISERLEIEIQLVENDRSLTEEEKSKQIRALQRTAKDYTVEQFREAYRTDKD